MTSQVRLEISPADHQELLQVTSGRGGNRDMRMVLRAAEALLVDDCVDWRAMFLPIQRQAPVEASATAGADHPFDWDNLEAPVEPAPTEDLRLRISPKKEPRLHEFWSNQPWGQKSEMLLRLLDQAARRMVQGDPELVGALARLASGAGRDSRRITVASSSRPTARPTTPPPLRQAPPVPSDSELASTLADDVLSDLAALSG